MKVSGFTVIRNALLMGYPVLESIRSLLPLVDEMIVGVGQSDDDTKGHIESLNDPKIKIFDSHWDTKQTKGGLILSEKTNEALERCSHNWCFYIQADEVLHEKDYEPIKASLEKYADDPKVEGLLFDYIHFYGAYNTIAASRKWYRREIRAIKKESGAQSYNDAQGFRIDGRKLKVMPANGSIYHYGWVKPPKDMGTKNKLLKRWWHGNQKDGEFEDYKYEKFYGLKPFLGQHPEIMKPLVQNQNWQFDPNFKLSQWSAKDWNCFASDIFEKIFHHRIGEYRPYKLIK